MATWGADSGSGTDIYVDAYENWNSSTHVSMHFRGWVRKHIGGTVFSDGASWNYNMGGVTSSWSGSYSLGGGNPSDYTWFEFDHQYAKDANGNINIGVYWWVNGNNPPYFHAAQISQTYTPARIGEAPGGRSKSVDTIETTSARIGANHTNNGRGTSSAKRGLYRLNNTGAWTQTESAGGTGWSYWTVTLSPNSMYGYATRHWNNNGDTAETAVSTFVTKAYATNVSNITILATTVSFTGIDVTQGYYATSTKVQYRVKGTSEWMNSDSKTGTGVNINLVGLLPSTTYERRIVTTTTAGTHENQIYEFTTLPAAKIVQPDNTVLSGIPRLVKSDGSPPVILNVSIIESS